MPKIARSLQPQSRPMLAPSRTSLSRQERARLIAEAQAHSRRLKDDPAERTLLDEMESLQAENAHDRE